MASLSKKYSKRKLLGQVYTPIHIVHKILDEVGITNSEFLGKRVLDPACGDGRFLVEVVKRIIKYSSVHELENNLKLIYGWDIDQQALGLCRTNLNREVESLGLNISWNLSERNALEQKASGENFDFIIGNPPYIRIQHLPEHQRQFLQENYDFCRSGSTDAYVAFFELADHLLSQEGTCGYITPNSYFFSETARPLRRYFQEHENLRLVTNYGSVRVFDKTGTYSAITVFGKILGKYFRYEASDSDYKYVGRDIPFVELAKNDLWQLSVTTPTASGGSRLGDVCQISVGVTTLSDKLYLFKVEEIISKDIVRATSKAGEEVEVERDILKPIVKGSRLKDSDEPITEHILFPYQKSESGKHQIIPENKMKSTFPLAYGYLLSQKENLNKRDNGKPNAVAWYAFGRAQGLDTSFGKKIIFSPMNKEPKFILYKNGEATVYSGYFIKYSGDYEKLLTLLNSKEMADYMAVAGRDFRGGWKGYSKKIVENFRIDVSKL